MDSRPKSRPLALWYAAAVALSAAALFFGSGLKPVWWLMWLAPLPVLLLAPRARTLTAFSAASLAWTAGGLNMWTYERQLGMPLWLVLFLLIIPAVAAGFAVLLFRAFLRRGNLWLAVVSWPCVWVAYEFIMSLTGTYGDVAYTQMRFLPVVQIAALAGVWGAGFLVLLFSSTVAALVSGESGRQKPALAAAMAAVFILALGYGGWRLRSTPSAPHSLLVGLAASGLPQNIFPGAPGQAMRLFSESAGEVRGLAGRGAQVVILPEMIARVPDTISDEIDHLFEAAAGETRTLVLVGVLHIKNGYALNEGRLYSPAGMLDAVYIKHHLVPGAEAGERPGSALTLLHGPAGVIGIEICKDMDYPPLARQYGKREVGLLLVPAWDFGRDGLWHARMAFMRGVENGFTIARVAKNGLLTISDDRGRILAGQNSAAAPFATLLARAPVRHEATLYTRWGDWFAWLNVGALALILFVLACSFKTQAKKPWGEE
ncbi:MAG: nitrilase-related carbon-nitrogen hydrolase [Terriglobia bacterium]